MPGTLKGKGQGPRKSVWHWKSSWKSSSCTMKVFSVVATMMLVIHSGGCTYWSNQPVFLESRRPKSVPPDAVLVQLAKGGVWQRCEVDASTSANRCQIFSWKGQSLYDEMFLPYDQGPAVAHADLRIPRYLPAVGPDWVCLKNGRILLPLSRFDQLKVFLDRTTPPRQ